MKNKVGIRILVPQHVTQNIWRNKSCRYKEYKYFTAASAQEQIDQLERRGLASVGSLKAYACQFCGAYHIGYQKKTA